jgi:hypothetical protein
VSRLTVDVVVVRCGAATAMDPFKIEHMFGSILNFEKFSLRLSTGVLY